MRLYLLLNRFKLGFVVVPILLLLSLTTHATNFTVSNGGDAGTGTGTSGDLRYCINQANLSAGPHTITFTVSTVTTTSSLPAITKPVTIDGGPSMVTIKYVSSGDYAIYMIILSNGSDGSYIKNLNFKNSGYEPIHIDAATTSNVSLEHLTCSNSSGDYWNFGIYVTGNAKNLSIKNFVMNNLQAGYYGIYIQGAATNVTIDSVYMNGLDASGIGMRFVGPANTITIKNSYIDLYTGKYLNNGGDYGILFDNTSTNVTMDKDTISGADVWGIYLGGAVTNFTASNLKIDSNHYGDFRGIQCFNTVNGFTLSNVLINMKNRSSMANTDDGNYGIYFNSNVSNLSLDKLVMHDAEVFGLYVTGTLTNASITNSTFDNVNGYGGNIMMQFNNTTTNLTMTNVSIDEDQGGTTDDGDYGIRFICHVYGANFNNVSVNEADVYGVQIWLDFKDVTWNGGNLTKNGRGIWVDNCNYNRRNVKISNLRIDSSTYQGVRWPACTGGLTDSVAFINDTVTNNGMDGLYFDYASVATIFTVSGCFISANGRTNAAGDGIQINNPDNVVITKNSITNNVGLGINLTGSGNCNLENTLAPAINSVSPLGGGQYSVNFTLPSGQCSGNCKVEFFTNSAQAGAEGEYYVTSFSGLSSGTQTQVITATTGPAANPKKASLTMTYTRSGASCNGTSEFSNSKGLIPQGPGNVDSAVVCWYKADSISGVNDATNLSVWVDQSGNGYNLKQWTTGNQPKYYKSTAARLSNFNASVTFNGSSQWMGNNTRLMGSSSPYTFMGVNADEQTGTGYNAFFSSQNAVDRLVLYSQGGATGSSGYTPYGLGNGNMGKITKYGPGTNGYWTSGTSFATSLATKNAQSQIIGFNSDNTVASPALNTWADGYKGSTFSSWNFLSQGIGQQPYFFGALGLGTDYDGTSAFEFWQGKIPEFFAYSRNLTDAEMQRINSYLAIKYGITLGQGNGAVDSNAANYNYVASDGTTVTWDATLNTNYKHDIVGIGRDDNTDLYQKQSRSVNKSAIMTIGLGTIAATNVANTNSFSADKSFEIIADNGATGIGLTSITGDGTTILPTGSCRTFRRLNRTFRVQETGSVGNVMMQFDMTGIALGKTVADYYLAINNTASISGVVTALIPASSYTAGILTFNNVNLSSGQYFTVIGNKSMAPANISTNLRLWLKAEDGIVQNNGAVTEWDDQGPAGINVSQASTTNQPLYNTTTGLLNFNPTLQFDGSNDNLTNATGLLINSTVYTGATMFTVTNSENPAAGQRMFTQAVSGDEVRMYAPYGNTIICDIPGGNRIQSPGITTFANKQAVITTGVKDNSGTNTPATKTEAVYVNGTSVVTGTGVSTYTANNGLLTVGGGYELHNGKIGEVLFYSSALTPTERQKIQSYLSLKWGVSMDTSVMKTAASANNYLASDGTAIWNANNSYYFRVTGIGRDDCSDLDQRQSRNQDTTSAGYVTMGLGSVAASNALNNNAFTADKSFEIWSDNGIRGITSSSVTGDGTTTLAAGSCPLFSRLAKTFNVQETGTVGNVQVQVNINGLKLGKTAADFYLAINNSASISGTITKLVPAASFVNNVITFNNVDFATGQYFTVIGRKAGAPANISNGLALWLKADDGVVVDTTSGKVTEWDDQGPQGNYVTQATAANQPVYNTAANMINFNPAIQFNGSNNQLLLPGGLLSSTTTYTGATFFTVANSYNPGATQQVFRQQASPNDVNFCSPYSNSILFDAPFGERINVGYTGYATGFAHIASGIKDNTRATTNFIAPADTSQIVFADGKALAAANGVTNYTGVNAQLSIGGNGAGNGNFVNGKVGEVIYYTSALTLTERQKINSYLATKWGISLDTNITKTVAASNNFIAGDGTTYWTANATHYFRVTGIGRDDCSDLDQRQSCNQDTLSAGYATMGLGTIAANNAANTHPFTADKSFEMWSDNGLQGTSSSTITGDGTITLASGSCPLFTRLAKTFMVQETGTVGVVQVKVNIAGLRLGKTASDFYLAINNSSSISGMVTKLVPAASFTNNTLTFNNIDFSNGQYFTVIGRKASAPANVSNGLALWLRGDDGVVADSVSGKVSEWDDQGPQGNFVTQPTAANQPAYNTTSSLINFNPVVQFDGSNDQLLNANGLISSGINYTGATLFSVTSSDNSAAAQHIFRQIASPNDINLYTPYGNRIIFDAPYSNRIDASYNGFVPKVAHITTAIKDNSRATTDFAGAADTSQIIFADGKAIGSANAVNTYTGNNSAFYLGSGSGVDFHNGKLGEIIYYTNALSLSDRQKINSYLSLKWGVTMDTNITKTAATGNNYLAGDGTTIWNANATHYYRVTGIGRDDCSDLDQRQSRNQDTLTKGYVTMGLGKIDSTNAANSHPFSGDKSFEIWSDDGANGIISTPVNTDGSVVLSSASCPLYSRIARTFKVQETGTVGPVQVQVNLKGLNLGSDPTQIYLAINNSSTFGSTVTQLIGVSSYVNNVATFDNVDFNNTNANYFTVIGKKVQAPAGISSGLVTWLKSDDDVDTAAGAKVDLWSDQSAAANDFSQSVTAEMPTYDPNGNAASNFNPTITYNGSGNNLEITNGPLSVNGAGTIYSAVSNSNITSGYADVYNQNIDDPTLGKNSGVANPYYWDNGSFAGGITAFSFIQNRAAILGASLGNSSAGTNSVDIYFNGAKNTPATAATSVEAGTTYIGGENTGESWTGTINEVIVYNRKLSATEHQTLQSYLDLKWGVSPDTNIAKVAGSANNLIAADGGIIWTANPNFYYRITGIGRNDCSDLYQKQSRNVDTSSPGYITMGLGTIAPSNVQNNSTFLTDTTFLVWADDGVAGKATTPVTGDGTITIANTPCASFVRMAKTFKTQERGNPGTVQVQVNLNGMTIGKYASDFYLALNNAANFGTATTIAKLIPATSYTNGVATFDNVDFSLGTYFTVIGQKVQAPANIQTTNLKLWLKAEDGITVNGTTVQEWDDNSPALNNVFQSTAANQPVYNNATSLINFNPALTFNGSATRLSTTYPVFGMGNLSYTAFGVVNTTTTAGYRYWLSDGTATTNQAVGFAHNAATLSNVNWSNDLSTGTIATGTTYLEGFTRDNSSFVRNNLLFGKNVATSSVSGLNKVNTLGSVGSDPNSTQIWNGQIGEIIAYQSVLTPAEQQKIHSYLAVKWGLTLDQTTPTDYLSSAGDTIWNKTTNAGYKFRITAIGQDSCFDMIQRQSQNQASGSILSIGLGTIAASNATNTNNFTGADKNYVIVGDDNASNAEVTTDLPKTSVPGTKRINREWKADVTGIAPSNLELKFDLSATGVSAGTQASDLMLVIDADGNGNFSDGNITKIPATSWSSNIATFDNVTLNDGVTFTVITKPQPLTFSAKVFLQGPFGASTMSTALNAADLLPTTDPYGLNITPSVNPNTLASIVDWVKIEVRDSAVPTHIIASRAAFVLSNGTIVDTNSTFTQPVYFTGLDNGNYKYAIRHRNHLGVMTNAALTPNSSGLVTYDYTTNAGNTGLYGTKAQKQVATGVWAMWAGDVNGDNKVLSSASSGSTTATTSDMSLLISRVSGDAGNTTNVNTYSVPGVYAPEDINMDGNININPGSSDATFLKNEVKAVPGNTLIIPSWIITAQLP